MRTKTIMNLLCMAVLCAAATAVSSCSDDSPEKEAFKPKPDNWLAQLYPHMAGVCKPSGSVSGTQYFVLDYGIAVEDKDNPYYKSLFTPGTEKEYYVEYEGQKYFLGDTVPIPGNSSPVRIEEIAERGGKYLRVTNFGSYNFEPEWYNHAPLEYGYTFVWPEKDIRTHIEVYIKFNPNYVEDRENAYNSLKDGECAFIVPTYWVGEWIDGESLGDKFYHAYAIKR